MEKTLKALLMTDYCAYTSYVHKGMWVASKFHKYLCNAIQDFVLRPTEKAFEILILSTPPQHGKSTSVTETLPSWYLGRYPSSRVIEVSYNEDYAQKFGRRNRQKIKEYGKEIFGISLGNPDTNTEFEFAETNGGMISRGVLTGITGNPANLMIIDDPIKNQQDADSETMRDKIWNEWLYSMRTRLAPGAKVILIQTRWHEDDLAGRMMENEDNVTVINFPVEAEEGDVLGRKVGEALCPEIGRDDLWLKDFKKGYVTQEGSRAWNALYQGHPTGLEGNMFKREWWQYYDVLPDLQKWVMSVDAAFKDGDDNDFVAIQVWGKTGPDMYLVDAVKRHLNLPDTIREIMRLRATWPQCRTTLIEDKANGSAIINIMRKMTDGIIAINPNGGKVSRANAIIGAVEAGNVWLPRKKPFTWDFVDEISAFPNGKHDDAVDACTQALNRLIYNDATIKAMKDVDPLKKYFPSYKKKGKKAGRGEKINVI